MHLANELFWEYVQNEYSSYLSDAVVYEFGSYDVNDGGVLRRIASEAKVHVGVDWRLGPNVDVVSLAHEVDFDDLADVILSASMLEHDPYWELSLSNMVRLLRPDGLMAISWGAALNPLHCEDHSPDGRFLPLKAQYVVNHLSRNGINIIEFLYEGLRYPEAGGTMGEVALIGVKGDTPTNRVKRIDDFIEADLIDW